MPRTSFYDAGCHHGTTTYHRGASVHQKFHQEVPGGGCQSDTEIVVCNWSVLRSDLYQTSCIIFKHIAWRNQKPNMEKAEVRHGVS